MLAQSDAYPTLQASFVDDIIVKAETIGLVSYFSDLTEVLKTCIYMPNWKHILLRLKEKRQKQKQLSEPVS